MANTQGELPALAMRGFEEITPQYASLRGDAHAATSLRTPSEPRENVVTDAMGLKPG
jgi:hypothetical protein